MDRTGVVSAVGAVCAAVLYVCLNVLVQLAAPGMRVDLTEDELFTLSSGTGATLARIDEPIALHLFFSERLGREVPAYAAYERRVSELLTEIAGASAGKVVLHVHDPKPYSPVEDLAVSLGVQGIPVDEGGELAYFGLAGVNSVDQVERIAFFQPQREHLLEYDLTQMLHALSNPEPAVLGFMSALPVFGDMAVQMSGGVSLPWAMAEPIRDAFEVINLPQTFDDLPPQTDVLAVVHPDALGDRVLYEIEQFLFRGGRAAFFLDPKAEADSRGGPRALASSAESLRRLLDRWGVSIPPDELVADRTLALRINAGSSQRPVPAEYVVWLGVTGDHMAGDDPVTSQLPRLNVASAGHIVRRADSPLTLTPLVFSSANSSTVPVEAVRGLRPDVLGLLESFRPDDRVYVLAARLTGEVDTAFPDGPPPRRIPRAADDGGGASEPAQLKRSRGPIHVVLVADSDLFDDRFWIQKREFFGREVNEPVASNASFVLNVLNHLSGSDELIALRSRGVSSRAFDRVVALRREAERRLQDQERALREKLEETRAHIARLERGSTGPGQAAGAPGPARPLNGAERREVARLRGEMLAIRQQLRDVQRDLRSEVERLETWLEVVNVGLMPALVALVATVLGGWRLLRRRRAFQAG